MQEAAWCQRALKRSFEAFAERLDAPVSASLMCQGAYDQKKTRYLGMLGMHGTKVSALAMKNVICLSRLDPVFLIV